jgi:hypothetical protein
VKEPGHRSIQLANTSANGTHEWAAQRGCLWRSVPDLPALQIRHQAYAATNCARGCRANIRSSNRLATACCHNAWYWQRRISFRQMNEDRRLPFDDAVSGLLIYKLQYETASIGALQSKVSIPLAVQGMSSRRYAVQLSGE